MKALRTIMSLAILFCIIDAEAQKDDNFQAVVEKGKADLIEVLATGEQFNFDIEADAVKSAKADTGLPFHEMNFDQLLKYDEKGIQSTLQPESKKIIPLVSNESVVTTISISNVEGKYRVTDLINHQYGYELNQLPSEAKKNNFKSLRIIYVPNLNTTIYTFNEKSYTSYGNRSLKERMDTEELMKILKTDAIKFEKELGLQAKKGKLLN